MTYKHKSVPRVPKETQDKIVELYTAKGLTMKKIGKLLHMSNQTVANILDYRGIKKHPHYAPPTYEPTEEEIRQRGMEIRKENGTWWQNNAS